ncbi:MAG: THUMP domain-containing protein, partial [Leptospiraceae bacterium]|nr:THUMP domain-containing protein [Leptospiraceae bacterium]
MKQEKNFFNLNPEKLEFHSSCSEGLNDFLLQEIQNFNLKVLSYNRGGVFFKGHSENLYKFFFSTRFSSRISFTL